MQRSCGLGKDRCELCCRLLPMKRTGKSYPETVKFMEEIGMLKPGEESTFLKDWDKPAGVRCQYQKFGKGCSAYATRPMGCRTWSCAWLTDDDTAGMKRPDRSHFVIDPNPDYVIGVDGKTGQQTTIPVMQIWNDPDYPDAHRDPILRRYLERAGRKGVAAIIRFNRDRGLFICPPALSETGEWHEIETIPDEVEHTPEQKVERLGALGVSFHVK